MAYTQNLTPQQALQKIKQYCAYQERSHFETKNKLFEFGLNAKEVDNIIATLIEENFLNEERFATLFAGGKFRIKHWGRVKIKYELQLHKVSTYNITKALKQIDEDEYLLVLEKLCNKYCEGLKGKKIAKNYKTKTYLQSKGFELNLINEVLKKIS